MYTHVGYSRELSGTHTGRLYGHGDYRGVSHALSGAALYSGACFTALCGKTVTADHDGDSFNIAPATDDSGAGVMCKRCMRLIENHRVPSKS
jgi:hypothetical protein